MDEENLLMQICLPSGLVDTYMQLITNISPGTIYAFNTHFFQAFCEHGYSGVHRWTKNIDIFSKKKLFVPVYYKSKNTWGLIKINIELKLIRFFNSLGDPGIDDQHLIMNYLTSEYLNRKGSSFITYGWTFTTIKNLDNGFRSWDSLFVSYCTDLSNWRICYTAAFHFRIPWWRTNEQEKNYYSTYGKSYNQLSILFKQIFKLNIIICSVNICCICFTNIHNLVLMFIN